MGVIYYFIHWDEQYLSIMLNIFNIIYWDDYSGIILDKNNLGFFCINFFF